MTMTKPNEQGTEAKVHLLVALVDGNVQDRKGRKEGNAGGDDKPAEGTKKEMGLSMTIPISNILYEGSCLLK